MAKKSFKDESAAEMFVTKDISEDLGEEEKSTTENNQSSKVIENQLKVKKVKSNTEKENKQLPLFEGMPMTIEEAKASGQVQAKSRRVGLLMQPHIYDKAKAAAERRNLSFNEYIHSLVEEAEY